MTKEDFEWLHQKRKEVVRGAEKFDQRHYDAPRFLWIIDELISKQIMAITETEQIENDS